MRKIAILSFNVFLLILLYSCRDIKVEYYSDGKTIKAKAEAKDGKLHGDATTYYEDGTVEVEAVYKNGLLEGIYKEYYPNGKLKTEILYSEGKRDGKATEYFENGNLKIEKMYINDTLSGLYKEFYENKGLKYEVNFIDGKQEGLMKQYYEDGTLMAENNYKNGLQHGEQNFFYENGETKMKAFLEKDVTVFYQKYDTEKHLVQEYRKVLIEPNDTVMSLGESLEIRIELLGPGDKSGYDLWIEHNLKNVTYAKYAKAIHNNGNAKYLFNPEKEGVYIFNALFKQKSLEHSSHKKILVEAPKSL